MIHIQQSGGQFSVILPKEIVVACGFRHRDPVMFKILPDVTGRKMLVIDVLNK